MLYDFYGNDIVFVKHSYSTRYAIDGYAVKNAQRVADEFGKPCEFARHTSLSGSLFECKKADVLSLVFGNRYHYQ